MATLIRTGSSVLRYRGGTGQWAWAIHRAAGLGVLAFLLLHIFDIFLAAFGPQAFNDLLFLYKGPAARLLEVVLLFGLLYHAINGLRIILADFIPMLASRNIARTLFYAQLVAFLIIFVPISYFMMVSLPYEPFRDNFVIGAVVTVAILALPVVIAGVSSLVPTAANTRLDSDSTVGNYQDGLKRIIASRQLRPMNRTEINIWLFMRISGFLLIALALGHFFLMHLFYGVENMDFKFIIDRWMDPGAGFFWRSFDLLLLAFSLTHGLLGARYVIEDYFHQRGLRFVLLAGALLSWVAFIVMGAFIIFTFNATA